MHVIQPIRSSIEPKWWNQATDFKRDRLDFKKIALDATASFILIFITKLFLEIFCKSQNLSPSLILSSIEVTLLTAVAFSWFLFRHGETVLCASIFAKRWFNLNHDRAFIQETQRLIKCELESEVGREWLQLKQHSMQEALIFFTNTCCKNSGTCQGESLTFLNAIQDGYASLADGVLESKMCPLLSLQYQVRRELKVDVRNDYISKNGGFFLDYEDDPKLKLYDQYDPFTPLRPFRIYHQSAGKGAEELLFEEMQDYAETYRGDHHNALVGTMTFSGSSSPIGHTLMFQLNFNRYRYRDSFIRSFKTIEELFVNLYQLAKEYLESYNQTEICLWKMTQRRDDPFYDSLESSCS